MTSQISRRSFFDVWFANAKESRQNALLQYILQELGIQSVTDDILKTLKAIISRLSQKIEEKWSKSGRHRERFLKTNSLWLEENISFAGVVSETIVDISQPGTSNRAGRPPKDFEFCSEKTKRRRIRHLLETTCPEEISMANEMQLRQSGKRDSAAIVKELCLFSPRRGTQIKKARRCLINPKQDGFSNDQALALMVDANLTTHQYSIIREQSKLIKKKTVSTILQSESRKKIMLSK